MGILDGIVEWIATQIMNGLDLITTSVLGALGCDMGTFLRYFPAAETMNGTYLPTQYKVCLGERPADGSLDALFDAADGDTDFYFDSDREMLQWFRERSPIDAATLMELKGHLDMYCVSIHEFVNPY